MAFTEVTENSVTFNKSSSEFSWRLVYSGTDIISLEKTSGITATQHSAYQSANFNDIVSHIQTNSLNHNSIIIDKWQEFYNEAMLDVTSPDINGIQDMLLSFHPDNWTLVYENGSVIALQQESIKIETTQSVFTSSDIYECFDKIVELSLTWANQAYFEELYPDYFE